MDEPRARLARCFAAVFPELDPAAIDAATPATVPGWDSLASVTLLALVEEEFGVRADPADLERLTSFAGLLDYVTARA